MNARPYYSAPKVDRRMTRAQMMLVAAVTAAFAVLLGWLEPHIDPSHLFAGITSVALAGVVFTIAAGLHTGRRR